MCVNVRVCVSVCVCERRNVRDCSPESSRGLPTFMEAPPRTPTRTAVSSKKSMASSCVKESEDGLKMG